MSRVPPSLDGWNPERQTRSGVGIKRSASGEALQGQACGKGAPYACWDGFCVRPGRPSGVVRPSLGSRGVREPSRAILGEPPRDGYKVITGNGTRKIPEFARSQGESGTVRGAPPAPSGPGDDGDCTSLKLKTLSWASMLPERVSTVCLPPKLRHDATVTLVATPAVTRAAAARSRRRLLADSGIVRFSRRQPRRGFHRGK